MTGAPKVVMDMVEAQSTCLSSAIPGRLGRQCKLYRVVCGDLGDG